MPQPTPTLNTDQIRLSLTLAVAIIALVQPWLIAVWKRYFRTGSIDIFETSRIEIGYSAFGPTLCLQGTLRARHRDVFIQRIELELTRERDGSTHTFQWLAFRSPTLDQAGTSSGVEIAASFMVSTANPHTYVIVFNDQRRLEHPHTKSSAIRRMYGCAIGRS